MEVISRKEAFSRGLVMFFTGIPCKYGHLCQRYVNGRKCRKCRKCCIRNLKTWQKKNAQRPKQSNPHPYRDNSVRTETSECMDCGQFVPYLWPLTCEPCQETANIGAICMH